MPWLTSFGTVLCSTQIVNIRELIGAMRRNMKNEEFLKYAVFLLGNLAQNEQLSGVIGIEGGIQLILQIMELYATNARTHRLLLPFCSSCALPAFLLQLRFLPAPPCCWLHAAHRPSCLSC